MEFLRLAPWPCPWRWLSCQCLVDLRTARDRWATSVAPARRTARPAICRSWIMLSMTPAAFRARVWPTMPWDTLRASSVSSSPRPRMWDKRTAKRVLALRIGKQPRAATAYVPSCTRTPSVAITPLQTSHWNCESAVPHQPRPTVRKTQERRGAEGREGRRQC
eukprot:scaffold1034_cov418-Prasinococcus_capsulatus_cf.AAC.34